MLTFRDPDEPSDEVKQSYIYRYQRICYQKERNCEIQIMSRDYDVLRTQSSVWSPTGDPLTDLKYGSCNCLVAFSSQTIRHVLNYLYFHQTVIPVREATHRNLVQLWRCATRMDVKSLVHQVRQEIANRFPDKRPPTLKPHHWDDRVHESEWTDFSAQFPEQLQDHVMQKGMDYEDGPPVLQTVTVSTAVPVPAPVNGHEEEEPAAADPIPAAGDPVIQSEASASIAQDVPDNCNTDGDKTPDRMETSMKQERMTASESATATDSPRGPEVITLDDEDSNGCSALPDSSPDGNNTSSMTTSATVAATDATGPHATTAEPMETEGPVTVPVPQVSAAAADDYNRAVAELKQVLQKKSAVPATVDPVPVVAPVSVPLMAPVVPPVNTPAPIPATVAALVPEVPATKSKDQPANQPSVTVTSASPVKSPEKRVLIPDASSKSTTAKSTNSTNTSPSSSSIACPIFAPRVPSPTKRPAEQMEDKAENETPAKKAKPSVLCDVCGAQFALHVALNSHKKRKHANQTATAPEPPAEPVQQQQNESVADMDVDHGTDNVLEEGEIRSPVDPNPDNSITTTTSTTAKPSGPQPRPQSRLQNRESTTQQAKQPDPKRRMDQRNDQQSASDFSPRKEFPKSVMTGSSRVPDTITKTVPKAVPSTPRADGHAPSKLLASALTAAPVSSTPSSSRQQTTSQKAAHGPTATPAVTATRTMTPDTPSSSSSSTSQPARPVTPDQLLDAAAVPQLFRNRYKSPNAKAVAELRQDLSHQQEDENTDAPVASRAKDKSTSGTTAAPPTPATPRLNNFERLAPQTASTSRPSASSKKPATTGTPAASNSKTPTPGAKASERTPGPVRRSDSTPGAFVAPAPPTAADPRSRTPQTPASSASSAYSTPMAVTPGVRQQRPIAASVSSSAGVTPVRMQGIQNSLARLDHSRDRRSVSGTPTSGSGQTGGTAGTSARPKEGSGMTRASVSSHSASRQSPAFTAPHVQSNPHSQQKPKNSVSSRHSGVTSGGVGGTSHASGGSVGRENRQPVPIPDRLTRPNLMLK